MSNKLIDIVDITKSFDDTVVLDKLNLYIRENEFLTLLGPSGCGKTTLLRILEILFLTGKILTNFRRTAASLTRYFRNMLCFPICQSQRILLSA